LILIQFIFGETDQENIGREELGLKFLRSEKKVNKVSPIQPRESTWEKIAKARKHLALGVETWARHRLDLVLE